MVVEELWNYCALCIAFERKVMGELRSALGWSEVDRALWMCTVAAELLSARGNGRLRGSGREFDATTGGEGPWMEW